MIYIIPSPRLGGYTLEAMEQIMDLEPQALIASFKERFGERIDIHSDTITTSVGGHSYYVIWIELQRELLKEAVGHLMSFQYPHFATISGRDLGEEIELCYHFSIGYGIERGEQSVNFRIILPKSDLKIGTITDLVPGALTAEREKIEFLGVEFAGIPDSRNIFLPYGMKEHPWRKDE